MATPQSYKRHTRIDPLFHFVITPILLGNFVFAIVLWNSQVIAGHPYITLWWIVLSFGFLLLSVKTRIYSLRVQDRVIRLEERFRLIALLPSPEHVTVSSFTTGQLIALRFASDSELPALARRTLSENLTARQIKESIKNWRPDHNRI